MNPKFALTLACLAVTALASLPQAALAQVTVPAASYSASVVGATPIGGPGSLSAEYCNTYACSLGTASTTAEPSVIASDSATAGPAGFPANGEASAAIQYYYYVEALPGASPDVTQVPLTFTGNMSTSASGPESAATAILSGAFGNLEACSETYATCADPASINVAENYSLAPNTLSSIYFEAGASLFDFNGSATASVDPVITINPSFLADNPDFALVFSSGITNSPVPLPASWTMLIIGILALGTIRSPKRQTLNNGLGNQLTEQPN